MKLLSILLLVAIITGCASQPRVYPQTYQQERYDWEMKQRDTLRNAEIALRNM